MNHFAGRYHEWFLGKMLRVASHQIGIVLAHLDFVKDEIFGIGERFVGVRRPFEVQAIVSNGR